MGEILQKTQLKSDILLRKFTKVIPHISDLDKFLKLVIDLIANIFKIENISMVLLDEETGKCLVRVSTVSREENSNVQFRTKESSITWLTDHTKFLYKGEFRSIQQIGITPSLVKEMNLIGLNMCIPLTVDNRIIGFLGLGEKINNESFTSDDLRLLSMLTDYLAVIIDHAFFHKAVFNQKEHHRNILDNITCGTITVDTEGKVTTFNRSAEAILGFKAHHVIGKDVQMIQGNLANLILDTLRTGKIYRREEIHILPENILLGVSTSRLYNANGELTGAAMIFANLLEIKHAEKEIKRKGRNIFWNRIAESLSHEIKNALSTAKTFLQLYPEKFNDMEFKEKFYGLTLQNIDKLEIFIDKLNKFARPLEKNFEAIDIHEVIDDVLFSIFKEKNPKNITFVRNYGNNLPNIMGNYSQLQEVFSNLILNGIEAMPEGGTLTITTELEKGSSILSERSRYLLDSSLLVTSENEYIVVSVMDTGIGIPKEDISKIFEPFFSIKKGRASLGLAIVSKIVENHNGFIKVESELGEGSNFFIYLPVDNL